MVRPAPVKHLGTAIVILAGAALGIVAWRAGTPDYVPPRLVEAPDRVPIRLSAEVPPGYVVRSLEVEGICCDGCGGKLFVALTSLAEVREAAVDPILGVAQAVVPAGLDTARLEEALTFSKYSARLRREL